MTSFKRPASPPQLLADSKRPYQAQALTASRLTLGNHYQVECKKENELGRGGYGTVWRGVDIRTNEPVAVKQVQRKPETEKFCERELKFMKTCKHKNLLRLIEHTVDDSSLFFILEFCDGGNLDQFVKDKSIDCHVCLDYMFGICSGIQYMHDRDIAHRDLKPSNVLINSNCIKVADFGLVRSFTHSSSLQSATGGVGSAGWMAPELCTAAHRPKYGLAVDIFSLAVLFLSLLTHQPGERLTAHTGMQFAIM